MSIVAANGGLSLLTTSALNIPCTLKDDDDNTLLPKAPDTSAMAPAYQPAYVVPVYDVGDNSMNVPFVANVPEDPVETLAIHRWDSRTQNAPDFWVAYLLEGLQSASRDDRDPNNEAFSFGDTVNIAGGSLIYLEVHQPREGVGNPVAEERDTVVHETGHAVGRSTDEPVTDGASNFKANYLNHIRSTTRPWP
ncbi:MAG: hypothetical protein AABZ47_01895 [Planctomycetota bacterium]